MLGSTSTGSLARSGERSDSSRLPVKIGILFPITRQASHRHSLASCVNTPHDGTAQRPFSLLLLPLPPIGLGLLGRLLLHDALHALGLDAAQRRGIGIQLVEDLPGLLVHDPPSGAGRFGRTAGQIAVRADNVVVDVSPWWGGVRPLAIAEALLPPILAGGLLLLFGGGVRIAGIEGIAIATATAAIATPGGRLALLLLLHLQPSQRRPAPRLGHVVEPRLSLLARAQRRFRPAQDSCHHEHFHIPQHLVRQNVRPPLVGLRIHGSANLGRVETHGEGGWIHVLGRVADDGVD